MNYIPLQETHGFGDPYRVLVISMMLNLTNRQQVRQVLDVGFFTRWPTAADMARADHGELAGFIARLGLGGQRARRMILLGGALAAFSGPLTASDVPSLPGCGGYAQEAFRVFCDHDFDFDPQDRVLREYVNHFKEGVKWQKNQPGT